MSEFKGTKGKWELSKDKDFVLINRTSALRFNGDTEEMKANALLISKSPEMLEMLKNILDNEYVSGQTYYEIEQLIKQATEI